MQNTEADESEESQGLFDDLFDSGEYRQKLAAARNTIYVVGALQFIIGLVVAYRGPEQIMTATIGIYVVIACMYAGLGLWCGYKPLAATITALGLYVFIWLLPYFLTANTAILTKDIIFRVIVTGYLVKGIFAGKQAQDIKNMVKQE